MPARRRVTDVRRRGPQQQQWRRDGVRIRCAREVLLPLDAPHNARQAGKTIKNKTPEFDFIIFRSCGTAIRLHPDWNHGKFRCYNADAHATEAPIPRHGLGRTEGSGTVRRYKDMGVLRSLSFDTAKGKEKNYPGEREDPQ